MTFYVYLPGAKSSTANDGARTFRRIPKLFERDDPP
jgi:hypothetical protein